LKKLYRGYRRDMEKKLYLKEVFKKRFYQREGIKTNQLGIVACFNIAFCITGFLLFKNR
tara:strand:+ start:234 stop:410 length:177 start_codon:yes stop_codon:yes gene_type:complete